MILVLLNIFIVSQLTNIHIGIKNAVNTIYNIDIPSIPNTRFNPIPSIKFIFVIYWNSLVPSSILTHSLNASINVIIDVSNPISFSFFPVIATNSIPITGIINIGYNVVVIFLLIFFWVSPQFFSFLFSF